MKRKLTCIVTENDPFFLAGDDVRGNIELAVLAEKVGFDSVAVGGHVVMGPSSDRDGRPTNPRDFVFPYMVNPDTPFPNTTVLLSGIAAATSTIEIIAGAIIAPLRQPLVLAKELMSLDHLSEGRLVVLPTVGWCLDEYDALGIPSNKRGAIMDEQIEIMKYVWSNSGPLSFDGEFFQFENVHFEPKPRTPEGPPMYFGSSRITDIHPRILERIVRYGTGFLPAEPHTPEKIADFAKTLELHGRDLSEFDMLCILPGLLADEGVADVEHSWPILAEQLEMGLTNFWIKPSQFIDHIDQFEEWGSGVVETFRSMSAELAPA